MTIAESALAFVAPFARLFKAPPSARKPAQGEVGYADPARLFPGNTTVYNPDELVTRKGYSIFDAMMRDDQVKAALAFKKQSVIAAGWTVAPPAGVEDAEDDERTMFLRDTLAKIEGGFDVALKGVLTALDYGFSASEYIWGERESRVVLVSLKARKPHEMVLRTDVYGNLVGLDQLSRPLPLNKFLVYTNEMRFGNHYGQSDLVAAYRSWWTKKQAYQWMAMLLERAGIPPILAMYNPEDYAGAQISAVNQLLKNMQAATVGSIPRPNEDSLELWAPELAGQVSTVFIPAFEMMNKDIARALLMPGLLGMTDDQAQGSLARSQVHFDVFMLVLEDLRASLTRVVNERIIEPLLSFNFGAVPDDERPRFEFNPISKDERTEILAAWSTLVGAKVVTPQDADEEHARKLLEFPERDEADATKRAERQADEQADAAAKKAEALPESAAPPFKKAALNDEQFEALLTYAFKQ